MIDKKIQFSQQYLIKWLLANIALIIITSIPFTYFYTYIESFMMAETWDMSRLFNAHTLLIVLLLSTLFSLSTTWHLLFIERIKKFTAINISFPFFVFGIFILAEVIFIIIGSFLNLEMEGVGLYFLLIQFCAVPIFVFHALLVWLVTKFFKS